ncbi:MAG: hypothetical protein WC473_01950 [Patescibacteria group bacterium]
MEDEKKDCRTFTLHEVYALLEHLGVPAARLLAAKAGKPIKYGDIDLGQLEAVLNRVLADVPRDGQAAMIAAILRNEVTVQINPIQTQAQNEATVQINLSVRQAIRILGANKVIMARATARVWRQPIVNGPIRYTKATLKQAAAENYSGRTDWRLVFVSGKSLRQQYEIRGKGGEKEKQPCFHSGYTWWLHDKEGYWVKHQPASGYHLIDFKGRWVGHNWGQREAESQKPESLYERVNPAIFSEAILTNFMINGERLAEDWQHCSSVTDSFNWFVSVGFFHAYGLRVENHKHSRPSFDLRVCLFRKFDF